MLLGLKWDKLKDNLVVFHLHDFQVHEINYFPAVHAHGPRMTWPAVGSTGIWDIIIACSSFTYVIHY